eukprot:1712263-Amphidinium_carterae.1
MERCGGRDHQEVPGLIVESPGKQVGQLEPKKQKKNRQGQRVRSVFRRARGLALFFLQTLQFFASYCAFAAQSSQKCRFPACGEQKQEQRHSEQGLTQRATSQDTNRRGKGQSRLKEHLEAALAAVTAKKTNALPDSL